MDIKTRLFGKRQERYPVSAAQNAARTARSLEAAAYVGIAALALVTGAHAVMLVLHESAEFTLAGQTGLLLVFFTALRVGFPLLVELAAIVSVVGSIRGKWRGDQKGWAGRIEKIWLVFAAANMITFFAVERSAELQSWQIYWLQYGLPVSGIISGVWLAKLLLADPLHQRAEEEAETEEQREANQAIARAEVENSEAMMMVLKRRAWRDYANDLRAQGYDEEEIRFILSHVPELRQSVPTAPTNGANGHAEQMHLDAPRTAQSVTQGQQRSDLPPAGNGRAPGNGRPKVSSRPVQPTPVSNIDGYTQSGRPIRAQREPVNKARLWSNGSNTIYRESYCPSCRQHVAAGHIRNTSCPHCGVWIREATELEVLREGNRRSGVVLDQRLYRTGAWLAEKPTATHTNDGAPLSLDDLDLGEPGK